MSKSIVTNEYECFVCKTTHDLHKHHIFYGTSNRKQSEKYGCWVYLCARHHNMSNAGVHYNKTLDMKLKKMCQELWEEEFRLDTQGKPREAFVETFGRSYL